MWQQGLAGGRLPLIAASPHPQPCSASPGPPALPLPRSPTFTPSPRSGGFVHVKNPHLEAMDEDVLYHLDLGTKTHDLPAMFGDVKVTGRGRTGRRLALSLVAPCCRPLVRPPGGVCSCRRAAALQLRVDPLQHLGSTVLARTL